MYKIWFFLLLSTSLLAETITLAVAANVSYAMDELKAEFIKEHPETKVRIILGSSGKLSAQIAQGAPYGLFMSANMKYPHALYKSGHALSEPRVYVQGALALFSLKPRDFSKGVRVLEEADIKTIALANTKTAPYGMAAFEAMKNLGLDSKLKSKFIYAESVAQVTSYVLSAADIGFVAQSSLYSKKMSSYKENSHWISIDKHLYRPIQQGMVLLKQSQNSKAYKAFYEFILSPKAQVIFQRYGYTI